MVSRCAQNSDPGDKDRAWPSRASTGGRVFGFDSAVPLKGYRENRKPCRCTTPNESCACRPFAIEMKKRFVGVLPRSTNTGKHLPTFHRLHEKKAETIDLDAEEYLKMRKSIDASRGPPYGVGSLDNPFGITDWNSEKRGTAFFKATCSAHGKEGSVGISRKFNRMAAAPPCGTGPKDNPFGATKWKREKMGSPFSNDASSFAHGKQDTCIQPSRREAIAYDEISSNKQKMPYIFSTPIASDAKKNLKLRKNVHLPASMMYPPKYVNDPLAVFTRATMESNGGGNYEVVRRKVVHVMRTRGGEEGTKENKLAANKTHIPFGTKEKEEELGRSGSKMPEIGELIKISESVDGMYKEIDDLSCTIDTIIARLRTT